MTDYTYDWGLVLFWLLLVVGAIWAIARWSPRPRH